MTYNVDRSEIASDSFKLKFMKNVIEKFHKNHKNFNLNLSDALMSKACRKFLVNWVKWTAVYLEI